MHEATGLGGHVGRSWLPVENAGANDLWLFVEPYGEDYWLKPGEVFAVAPEAAGIDVCFSIAVCQEGITVWLYEDGDPTKVVLEYTVKFPPRAGQRVFTLRGRGSV